MSIDLSKLCADFLRQSHAAQSTEKLKASHAREIVAALFGYKSHAALTSEKAFPLDRLEEAEIFAPDIPLIEERRAKLAGLPNSLISSTAIAERLCAFLSDGGHCTANMWIYDSFESYVTEVFLIDCQPLIDDELSGAMAETNAGFYDAPDYDEVAVLDSGDKLVITAHGQYKGEWLDGKPFSGDTIDMTVKVVLPRIAGKRGFSDFELEVGGSVDKDWLDPKPQTPLAEELGITDDELKLLDWEVQDNVSNDGQVYDHVLIFSESNPPDIMEKIEGMSDDGTIRVSVNAFDSPDPDDYLQF